MRKEIVILPTETISNKEAYVEVLELLRKPYPSINLSEWKIWNEITGGFRAREFSIFCGATGAGKTALLASMSAQLLKQNVKHFVMSVETGHHDFMIRVLSALFGEDLNTGKAIETSRLARAHTATEQFLLNNSLQLSLYENRVSVEQLIFDLRNMREKGCEVAFIDNLNFFMEVTRSTEQILEMDRVVHELILFCKQVDMHIVMVMHPRKTEGEGRVLSEFDIKGSSTAVQEAHNIFLFNRPAAVDIKSGARNKYHRELIIKKMRRRGSHVGKTLLFEWVNGKYIEESLEWNQ